jgi:aminomethyltransferase
VALFQGDEALGRITSGAFAPSLQIPISMGYVPRALATPGTVIEAELRGKRAPVTVDSLPFLPANFKR